MKKKIDLIKAKQEQLSILLELYRMAKENEGKLYNLFADEEVNRKENWTDTFLCECGKRGQRYLYHVPDYRYYLVNRETKEVICYGAKARLKSFMRLRGITMEQTMITDCDLKW